MRTRRVTFLSLVLILLYSGIHALWTDRYPPMRNDDHFNTFGAVLTQMENPDLYPHDLAWSNTKFEKSHGFILLWLMRLCESLFGSLLVDSWWVVTFILLLIYMAGFYGFLYEFTGQHWVSLVLALGSTMPIYLYVTFANWGLTSIYAHVFVTAFAGWCLWGFVRLLKHESPLWQWFLLAIGISLTIYLNPVNGGGLIGILGIVLLVEGLAGRVHWRNLIIFGAGALLMMIPYMVNYAGSLTSAETPTPETLTTANDFIKELARGRIFPWTLNPTTAPLLIAGVALTALAFLLLYVRRDPPRRWLMAFVVVQLAPGYLLIGHPVFLLVLAYWWFRENPDRWDKLMLTMIMAVNLIAPVTSAVSQYFWLEFDINTFFTLTYEPIRLLRWVMVPVYVLMARWIAALITDEKKDSDKGLKPPNFAQPLPMSQDFLNWAAAACILAVIYSIFGSSNPVKDDAVFMKTYLPVRWGLAVFAIGVIWLKNQTNQPVSMLKKQANLLLILKQLTGIGFAVLGLGFVVGMNPLRDISTEGYLILVVLLAGLTLAVYDSGLRNNAIYAGIALFFVGTFILPVAGYHKVKPNLNWCDPPNLTNCANGNDVVAAAAWLQQATPIDAQLYVIGLQPERFLPLARRSTLHINYHQIFWFQGADALLNALEIDKKLVSLNPLRQGYAGDDYLMTTLHELNIDYLVVVGKGYTVDLPVLYENQSVIIYQINTQG